MIVDCEFRIAERDESGKQAKHGSAVSSASECLRKIDRVWAVRCGTRVVGQR